MKNLRVTLPISLAFVLVSFSAERASAQFLVGEVIKATVTKVIKAIDLKVQRMQNKTIWLQNAQKVLENQLAKLKLTEITSWTDKQRELYSGYYNELWKIKSVIAYYQRIKDLTLRQTALVAAYQKAWGLFQGDTHFRPYEIRNMQEVYAGILEASVRNLDQVMLVVNSFKTQMTDEERLVLLNKAGDRMDQNFNDLRQFNEQNILLSLHRAKEIGDVDQVKTLYGIH